MKFHPEVERIAQGLKELHECWIPHDGQVLVGAPLISGEVKEVFAQCGRNWGKALDIETEIPTPSGWKKLKDVFSGDLVFNEKGEPTRVIGQSPIYRNRECYELIFDDDSRIIADGNHNWMTRSKQERKRKKPPSKKTTLELIKQIKVRIEYNHQIQLNLSVQYPEKKLPIDPYLLGVWLGNGNRTQATLCQYDQEVIQILKDRGFEITNHSERNNYGVLGLLEILRENNLLKNKHIPKDYLNGSVEQRIDLLCGLMDTDGTVSKTGNCCFDNTNENIAMDFKEIAESLGFKCTVKKRVGKLREVEHKLCYRIYFSPNFQIFKLSRKAKILEPWLNKHKRRHRTLVGFKKVDSRPVKCISVESPSHLFLAGRQFLVTHNSELVSYLLWRYAYTFPGSENYYFAPYMKQAREILWATRRIQTIGPQHWIESDPNNTEMRITFTNGSFIKLDGSDNVEAYRGVKPKGLTVFDEFKDFRPEFYEAYDPNRAAFDSPLMIIGTPPEFECQFTKIAESYKKDDTKRFFHMPTSANPYISQDWLRKKRDELYNRGEGDKWEREYEAKFVRGGASAIFPMLSNEMVFPHEQLMGELWRDRKKLTWILWADPAGASCFAVLFCAINPYSKVIYCLDEIYETEQSQMTVGKIWPRIREKKEELSDFEWRQGYDEAATWFANEVLDLFGEGLEPTRKMKSDKMTGLSMIKDIMLSKRIKISSRCVKLFWEFENYRRDSSGKIPKLNDHLIDNFRYILDSEHYSILNVPEPKVDPATTKSGFTPADDFPDLFRKESDIEWSYD